VIVSHTALRESTVYIIIYSTIATTTSITITNIIITFFFVDIIIYKTVLFFVARFFLPFSALVYFNTRLLTVPVAL